MDPHSPHKLFATKYCFSYPEMIRVSFSLFLSFSVFCYFTLLLVFINLFYYYYFFIFFFFSWKLFFIFSYSRMFRNVPCSGFYRRPRHPHASENFCIRIFSLAGYGFRPHISGEYGIRNRNFFNPPSNALQSGYFLIRYESGIVPNMDIF